VDLTGKDGVQLKRLNEVRLICCKLKEDYNNCARYSFVIMLPVTNLEPPLTYWFRYKSMPIQCILEKAW
jgi:hypothetical protein